MNKANPLAAVQQFYQNVRMFANRAQRPGGITPEMIRTLKGTWEYMRDGLPNTRSKRQLDFMIDSARLTGDWIAENATKHWLAGILEDLKGLMREMMKFNMAGRMVIKAAEARGVKAGLPLVEQAILTSNLWEKKASYFLAKGADERLPALARQLNALARGLDKSAHTRTAYSILKAVDFIMTAAHQAQYKQNADAVAYSMGQAKINLKAALSTFAMGQ